MNEIQSRGLLAFTVEPLALGVMGVRNTYKTTSLSKSMLSLGFQSIKDSQRLKMPDISKYMIYGRLRRLMHYPAAIS